MSRKITHDGHGLLEVRFPFDRDLVDLVKTFPGRRWNATSRFWSIPETEVVSLVDLLLPEGFGVDEATRRLYVSMGGGAEITADASMGGRKSSPGLFDADQQNPDFTVSGLNERVREAIRAVFPSTVWLIGEISGFDKNTHRRHVSFELVERSDDGRVQSKIPAVLFGQTRKTIEESLRSAGDPIRLADEVSVRMRVKVDLYVAWGQYRVVVEELDVRFTLGEAARRREEIVRRLTASGLAELNRSLPVPALPLRVALITSLGSDAFNDVLRTLEESGFAFEVTAHGARVQGASTEASVLNALDYFRPRAADYDVLLICRGGGARTDLVWFDSEALGVAVAEFPIPTVVGIGHEQDQSVLDAVARSCKTPTAVAALLVDQVSRTQERLDGSTRLILSRAAERIHEQSTTIADRTRRLIRASNSLLRHERSTLENRQRRTATGTRVALAAARDRLARWTALIPRDARVLLERRTAWLDGATRTIRQAARHGLDDAARRVERDSRAVTAATGRVIERERERIELRERRLRLVDPQRVLERGYAVLRVAGGTVLTRVSQAPAGVEVRAQLRDGELRLRSEGLPAREEE